MQYIEFKIEITFKKPKYWLLWADEQTLNDSMEIIRIKGMRTIEKYYKEKLCKIKPQGNYDIAILLNNRWITIKNDTASFIATTDKLPDLNLEIFSKKCTPILSTYSFNFDFHTLLCCICENNDILILENNKNYTEATIIYKSLKISAYSSLLAYRGENIKTFEEICKEFEEIYSNYSNQILNIFNKIDEEKPCSSLNHKSIAYKTWYNAKRQNQREWPKISKISGEIEFPKNSGIYYYHEFKHVGLAKRTDANSENFIPKLYNSDHLNSKSSILYKYNNNLPIESKIKLPKTCKKLGEINENDKEFMVMDYYLNIFESHKKANKIIYENIIIDYKDFEETQEFKAQILDKDNKRIKILIDDSFIFNNGIKIIGIPALPYNYLQILHDYASLNRLKKGPIQDLTHIGIVDPDASDIITWPFEINPYRAKTLETHRLSTLKIQKNTKIRILYD